MCKAEIREAGNRGRSGRTARDLAGSLKLRSSSAARTCPSRIPISFLPSRLLAFARVPSGRGVLSSPAPAASFVRHIIEGMQDSPDVECSHGCLYGWPQEVGVSDLSPRAPT